MYFHDIAILQDVIPLDHLSVGSGPPAHTFANLSLDTKSLWISLASSSSVLSLGERRVVEVGLLAGRLRIDPYHTGHFIDFPEKLR